MTTLNRVVAAALIAASTIACVPRSSVETTISTAAPTLTQVEELAAARALWEASGPSSYQFEINGGGCECALAGRFQVFVEDHRVTEVIGLDRLQFMGPERGLTIDGLFEMIDEGLAVADEVDVTYDLELGFPRSFTIVWNREADDGTFVATIDALTQASS